MIHKGTYFDLNVYIFLLVDIDECSQRNLHGCQQSCTNTNGSFFCSCYDGYELATDKQNCEGKLLQNDANILHF